MERIARENRLDADHRGAGTLSIPGGFGLKGLDHLRDAGAIDFRVPGEPNRVWERK